MPHLRLSFTLSGGAALGAYQSGAMAALLVAVQHLVEQDDDRVRVEALGGASAGALVAFFAAHALSDGIDPVALLRTTWVERVSLDLLRSRHSRAPLDFEDMREGLRGVLGADGTPPRHPPTRRPQPSPVALHVALTGLQGLTYPIRAMRREQEITGVSYADWGRFVLEPGGGPERLFEPRDRAPLDFVLASAANPGGFAPRLLDRREDADAYRRRGIEDFPDEGRLWYSDGGLVQSEPLGRVLDAARALETREAAGTDGEVRRVNVVVDPRSEGPSGSKRWTDAEQVPGWEEGLSRALAILPAQILYDDLRRIEKRNTRLEWAESLLDAVGGHLDEQAVAGLDDVIDEIDEARDRLRERSRQRDRHPDEPEPRRKLRRVVEEIAGLVGKEGVAVDVISPRLLAEEMGEAVPSLLAGEFLGDFGGFLRQELRESDFRLGYESGRVWMERALTEAAFDDRTMSSLLDRVDAASPGDWREANRGEAGVRSLPWKARLRLARYALHVGRVVAGALVGR